MKSATVRMQDLIHAVLDYSQLGREDLKTEPINPEAMLKEIREDLRVQFENTGGTLEILEIPEIHGAPALIRQVFTNIISNAIKYRQEEQAPKIRIWGESNPQEVLVHIEDNGIGIPQEQAGRIFEIFRRLHGRETIEGTGIGLASCEKIVRLHNGKIWVNSEPSRGSIFSFSIPLAKATSKSSS